MSTDSQQEVAAELKIQHGGLIEFEAGLSKVDGEEVLQLMWAERFSAPAGERRFRR